MSAYSNPYRWVVLGVFLLVAGISQLLWLNFAPILSQIQARFGVSESLAGVLLLVFPLIYVFLSVPAGALTDRKGYRYSVGLGAVLMAAFSCLRIYDGSFRVLLAAQIGIAVGQPFAVNGISKLVADWFSPEQGALATGLGTMGMFIGMAAGLAATAPMVEAMGYRSAMIAFALISCAICAAFLALAKPNPASIPAARSGAGAPAPAAPEVSMRALLKNGRLRLIFFLAFLGLGFFNGLTTWLEAILAPNGLNSVQAGTAGGVLILGGIAGAVVVPAASDHFKRRKPFLVGSVVMALVTLYPLCASRDYSTVLMFSGALGFFFLPAFALLLDMCSTLAGEAAAGSATGVLMLAGNAGGVIVILAMEWVKGDAQTFQSGVFLMLAIVAAAALVSAFVPETFRKAD